MKNKELIFGILLIFGVIVLLVFVANQSWFKADETLGPVFSYFFRSNNVEEEPQNSPFQDDVEITAVSLGENRTDVETYIELASLIDSEEYINVTGWVLKTDNGRFQIPEARDFNTAEGITGGIYLRGGSTLQIYATEGQNRRISNDLWAVYLDKDFLQFPHGQIELFDGQSLPVVSYEY